MTDWILQLVEELKAEKRAKVKRLIDDFFSLLSPMFVRCHGRLREKLEPFGTVYFSSNFQNYSTGIHIKLCIVLVGILHK